jgi:hypothetical protein
MQIHNTIYLKQRQKQNPDGKMAKKWQEVKRNWNLLIKKCTRKMGTKKRFFPFEADNQERRKLWEIKRSEMVMAMVYRWHW